MTLEDTPVAVTNVAEVTPAAKSKSEKNGSGSVKKNKVTPVPAVPVKPAASIMSFFKKL